MLNIYVNTWGNYNENGADGGEWITLPMDEAELEERLEAIAEAMHDDDPEWFVNDYEWTTETEFFEVGEMERLSQLNEWCERIEGLSEYEQNALAAITEAYTSDLEEALDIVDGGDFFFYQDMDLTEVAEEIVNDAYFTRDTPDIFTRYFDYEAFGRDLGFDGYTETDWGVIYVG